MTGPTHRQYSISFACLAAMLIFKLGISEINYYFALPILLMASKSGALFPDVDHNWENVHDKTVINKIINTLIHVTKGKHRSWQTHSIDICLWSTFLGYLIPLRLYNVGILSSTNKEVITLLLLGFNSGWISHLFSDMLTSAGVRLFFFSKFKVKLVPKKIGKLKFNTGEQWENFNYKVMKIINKVLGVVCIMYPLIVNGYIGYIINQLEIGGR